MMMDHFPNHRVSSASYRAQEIGISSVYDSTETSESSRRLLVLLLLINGVIIPASNVTHAFTPGVRPGIAPATFA